MKMSFSKKLNAKRIIALLMVVLMVVGLAPNAVLTTKGAISDAATVAFGGNIATVDSVTFTACQSLTKQDKSAAPYEVNGNSYSTSLKSDGANNGFVGTAKARVFGVITSTKDTNVSLVLNAGKVGYICESDTDLNVLGDASAPVTFDADTALVTFEAGVAAKYDFDVTAGKFYYVLGVGTNLEVIDLVNNGGANDAPVKGEKYAINFAAMTDVTKLNGYKSEDGVFTVVSDADKAYYHDAQHGAAMYNGDKIDVKVAGAATFTLTLCQYGNVTNFKLVDASGAEVGKADGKSTTDGTQVKISYDGKEATTLSLVCEATGEGYLHSVEVENIDDSAKAESFMFIMDENAVEGVVATGEKKFADSTLLLAGETPAGTSNITQYTVKSGKKVTIDGKEYDSYTSGKRHADSNNILTLPGEGDGCLAVFTPAGKGMMTVYFNTTSFIRIHDFNADGTKNGFTDSDTGLSSYSFEVIPGHKYVMSTTGKTNNMFYAAYQYVVDEKISVPVTVTNKDATIGDSLKLELVDAQLGGDPITVKMNTTSLKLLNGHTYKVSSNDGGVAPLVNGQDTFKVVGDEPVEIVLNNVPDVKLSGKIVGTDASTVTKLSFTNMANGLTYEAPITGDSYEVMVKPGNYNAKVETTNGGVTYDRAAVKAGVDNVDDVYVEVADPASKRDYSYADIPNLEKTGTVEVEVGKPHTVGRADSTVKIPLTGKATVSVKAYYAADFTINGEQFVCESGTTSKVDTYETVVEGDVTIGFNATSYLTGISVIPMTEFKSELTVPGDYATLNEASDAILGMQNRPEGEAGRVTINLVEDVFEQTVMAAPYVTLKGNGHTISWYYGVGTKYYSVDPATGLYNKRLALDKYSSVEGNGSLWGGVFIVRGDNFIAEDTTFLNTYNYYLTDAEKTDIESTLLAVDRLAADADVSGYKFKERSNAFYIEANNIECYNCKILSSQDTLGRNGSANNGYHTYFRDCTIGGNVDYICGEFAAVFDNCKLEWKTYKNDASNNGKIGYIVAPKTSAYVFRNCEITTSGDEGSDAVVGKFGRTWGPESNASFINVETNGYIDGEGWGEMSTGEKASAIFNEYNNTKAGEAFGTSACTNNTLDAVVNYIDTKDVYAIDTVLASWRPVHYMITAQDYSIIEGAEAKVEEGADLTVKSDAQFSRFVMVLVDGVEVAPSNYTAVEGSTVVTLVAEYVATLAAGQHTLEVVSVDGSAKTTFTVVKSEAAPAAPSTGDATPIALYVIAMLGAAGVVLTSKKRRSVR